MSPRSTTGQDERIVSWSERIGSTVIGILAIFGISLIIYSGVKAVSYEIPPVTDNTYLTLADTEVEVTTPEESISEQEEGQSGVEGEEVSSDETIEAPTDEGVQPENISGLVATCNVDGVNIREEAQTGTTIIGQMIAGETISVLNRHYSEEWVQVSYEGQIGYVYYDYLNFD